MQLIINTNNGTKYLESLGKEEKQPEGRRMQKGMNMWQMKLLMQVNTS